MKTEGMLQQGGRGNGEPNGIGIVRSRVVGERAGNVDGGGSCKRDKERGASARGRGSTDRECGQVSRGVVAPWWC